ncbi:hypothetical protein QTI24_30760 [Variovorax sp. J22P240]|uniref:hypothetical protein n=1 Tax=Variovorax sp. J22P240 TaxID=3053514 RepID=UPI002575CA6C|nr:hypothetical protein [Variovorax sp. J22P240]MDM0003001.1 hypothetical protein [Variovorax sp. J22P240]
MDTGELGLVAEPPSAHAYHWGAESDAEPAQLSPTDLHQRLLANCRDEIHFSFMWRVASVSVPLLLAMSIWVILNP